LLITACAGESKPAPEPTSQSSGDISKLESLKVTDNGDDKAPGLDFTKPLAVTEPTITVVSEGSGDRIKVGQMVEMVYVAVDGNDGKTLEDGYSSGPQPIEVNDELKTTNALIYNAIVGAKVGSHVALAAPGSASAAKTASTPLIVFKLISAKEAPKVLEKPEGETVTPPAGLPTVKENDQGVPEISIDGAKAPTALVAQDLIKGKGAEVKATDTVVVNYVLYSFKDKKQLESSFTSKPLTSPLSGLIKGWQEGLTGKTVGSRVLLSIPADKAYGAEKGDLVFVVDILGVR
jgi:peptidylprolyl isomerase